MKISVMVSCALGYLTTVTLLIEAVRKDLSAVASLVVMFGIVLIPYLLLWYGWTAAGNAKLWVKALFLGVVSLYAIVSNVLFVHALFFSKYSTSSIVVVTLPVIAGVLILSAILVFGMISKRFKRL